MHQSLCCVRRRILCFLLCITVTYLTVATGWYSLYSHEQLRISSISIFEKELLSSHNMNNLSERKILFVESSGKVCLTRRQLCSVESAALHNPNITVIVFISTKPEFKRFPSSVPPPKDKFRDCDSTLRILQLPNIRMVVDTMSNFLKGTDLYDWVESGVFYTSEYSMFHAGDVLRAALLKRHGGIFLDLDCMVLKPIGHLMNTVGKNENNWLDAGVVAFERDHPFIDHLIKRIIANFKADLHVSVGPEAVTQAAKGLCGITRFDPGKYLCHNNSQLTIQPV